MKLNIGNEIELNILSLFRITIITSVYVFVSMRNSLENLKSCQKRDTATDNPQPCADCTCIATDGFSSKELFNIIERQNKTEEKYRWFENSVKDVQRKLSANDDRLSGFESRDTFITQQFEKFNAKIEEFSNNPIIGDEDVIAVFDREWEKRQDIFMKANDDRLSGFESRNTVIIQDFEKEIFKLNAKMAEFSNNPIIGDEDVIAVFDREWEKRHDILMKAFDSRESSIKDILDKKVQETETKVNTELEQMIKSQTDLQHQLQEINQNIEGNYNITL